jgi:hypothetical protein
MGNDPFIILSGVGRCSLTTLKHNFKSGPLYRDKSGSEERDAAVQDDIYRLEQISVGT